MLFLVTHSRKKENQFTKNQHLDMWQIAQFFAD